MHPLPRLLTVSLALLLSGAGLAAEPAASPLVVQVRPTDVGGGQSRPYAAGEVMDITKDAAPAELVGAVTANSVLFSRRGYYRQTILGGCFERDGTRSLRAQESIVWIESGDVGRVLISGNLAPAAGADHTIRYATDRTLIRWEYLGEGIPPAVANAPVRES